MDATSSTAVHRELVYRPLHFYERSQYFMGTHDETLSVTMTVNNPDCTPHATKFKT
jgi:hypothetical protein